MIRVIVKHALRKHKEFIIAANKKVNEINRIKQTGYLEKNIERDYYGYAPKFECLIAEANNEPVGMIIYSKCYWANEGDAIWISQIYVDRKYRKYGIFMKMVRKLREENKNTKIVSCGVKRGNRKTIKILQYYGAKEPEFKFFYVENNCTNNEEIEEKIEDIKKAN